MTEITGAWPLLTLPEAEAARLREEYESASVILEYGSGGSTVVASGLPCKRVFSVESDFLWAVRLQARIDELDLLSPATVHYVDIGPTGDWGRPSSPSQWQRFWRYPAEIWDEPFFRHPDIVLIDGRFRPACFVMTLMRIKRPVKILFDDYVSRQAYHDVERFLEPAETVGRMAIFDALPGLIGLEQSAGILDLFFRATYPKIAEYDNPAAGTCLGSLNNEQKDT
jgi:hypothetical protein